MDVEISTKFNINDEVYFPEFYEGEFYPSQPYVVHGVEIRFDKDGTVIVGYQLQRGDTVLDHIIEYSVFASYQECETWCHNRNKQEAKDCHA